MPLEGALGGRALGGGRRVEGRREMVERRPGGGRRRDVGLACGRPVLHSRPDIMTNYISNGSDIIKRDVWPVWSVSTPSPRPRRLRATPGPSQSPSRTLQGIAVDCVCRALQLKIGVT